MGLSSLTQSPPLPQGKQRLDRPLPQELRLQAEAVEAGSPPDGGLSLLCSEEGLVGLGQSWLWLVQGHLKRNVCQENYEGPQAVGHPPLARTLQPCCPLLFHVSWSMYTMLKGAGALQDQEGPPPGLALLALGLSHHCHQWAAPPLQEVLRPPEP